VTAEQAMMGAFLLRVRAELYAAAQLADAGQRDELRTLLREVLFVLDVLDPQSDALRRRPDQESR